MFAASSVCGEAMEPVIFVASSCSEMRCEVGLSFLLFFFFGPCCMAYSVIVPQVRTKPRAIAVKALNPNPELSGNSQVFLVLINKAFS